MEAEMERQVKGRLIYDGTDFLGWQETAMGPSIEQSLRKAAEQILQQKQKVSLEAASRTDAGVHSRGQVVGIRFSHAISPSRLQQGINALLPPTIRFVEVEEVSPAFHATLDCRKKSYHYYLSIGPYQLPHQRFTSWHRPKLDLERMQEAARSLLGKWNFRAFANRCKGDDAINPICTLEKAEIGESEGEGDLQIHLLADRFLYRMARNIVGTLVAIGEHRLPPTLPSHLLAEKRRSLGGPTAPPHGLFLSHCYYSL